MTYNFSNNLSSIGSLSRSNNKGYLGSDSKEWRTNLNKFVNKMNNPSSLFATSAVNIIHFKDNQI